MPSTPKKNKYPGITFKTESGRYIAFYEHRTDIIASGENEKDVVKNLKKMYKTVIEHEEDQENEKPPLKLPKHAIPKKFVEKL
jgi:predicted RNase H-like HicB family nuclease